MSRPLSLGTRLALVFGGLFLLSSLVGAMFAADRAGADAEEGFRRSMATLVKTVPAATGVSPGALKKAMGVDVAGFLPDGGGFPARLVSSLPGPEQADLRRILSAPGAAEEFVPGPVGVTLNRTRYLVFGAWRNPPALPGTSPPPSHLAMLLVPRRRIDRIRTAAAEPIIWIALAGGAGSVLLALVLARTVVRPLRRLADEAGRVADGSLEFKHVCGGGREIEELSESLESMTLSLRRSRDELVRGERAAAAGQMAAALAHEVRNPLTGAKMTIEMLMADEQRDSVKDDLLAVHRELQRLQMVVDELVSFARPAPPVFARVDLQEVAGEVLHLLGRQLEHAHVSARVQVPADGVPAARADANKIKQVLVNLVLNAMQAQARGGEIRIGIEPGSAGRVKVSVVDRGPGFGEGEAEKIFDAFYTTKQSGAGLGLTVSAGIIREHGGRLVARRKADGDSGAVFEFELETWKE